MYVTLGRLFIGGTSKKSVGGTTFFNIPIANDGLTEGMENWTFLLRSGSSLSVSVLDLINAPTVARPIVDQTAKEGVAYSFTLPTDVFTDLDEDQMVFTASSLPSWLKFANGKFTGTPSYTASESAYSIVVTASDGKGGTVNDTFNLKVDNVSTILGTAQADSIIAGLGRDVINGLAGNDMLDGGLGNDTLNGGLGNDRLTGGTGSDLFVFNSAPNATSNKDTITDFNVVDDTIQLENSIFTALGSKTGTLSAAMFKTGTNNNAGDASDRIIHNKSSGALFYDADGTGANAAVQIALIGNQANLTVADFVVI